ncbi:MAG TPA: hypothetical protein VL326_37315 [Kofleriaceae bacterium]|nr:hypothetical protein [Kofleriaceae bacterium]
MAPGLEAAATSDAAGSDAPPIAQSDLDAIARAVLERYRQNPETTPDGWLMKKYRQSHQSPIIVASDRERGRVLSPAALPSKEFALRSTAELQAEADRTQTNAYFILITSVDIDGAEARVWVGVDFMKPAGARGGLCCCSASQTFVKRGKSWRYKSTALQSCS